MKMKPLGKTLRELLSSVNFDDLIPIINSDPDGCGGPTPYRMAYDILLHTAPDSEGCPDIEVTAEDSWKAMSTICVEGNFWERCIDGNILLEDGLDVTEAQIACALLWHLTFYGWDEDTKAESYHSMISSEYYDTPYGRKAFEMEVHRDFVLGNREIKADIIESIRHFREEGGNTYALSEEEWNYLARHRRHCNGPKRKRDARYRRRIEELKKQDRCENTLRRLLEGQCGTSVSRDDLSFLSQSETRWGCEFQSRAYDPEKRVQYLIDLIGKYDAVQPESSAGRIAVRLASSSRHPVTEDEARRVTDAIRKTTGRTESALILARDDSKGEEIFVLVVGEMSSQLADS